MHLSPAPRPQPRGQGLVSESPPFPSILRKSRSVPTGKRVTALAHWDPQPRGAGQKYGVSSDGESSERDQRQGCRGGCGHGGAGPGPGARGAAEAQCRPHRQRKVPRRGPEGFGDSQAGSP